MNQSREVEEATIELRDVVRIIKKHHSLILGITLGAIVVTTLISLIIPPTYEAETTLRIKQPRGLSDSLLGELPMGNVLGTKQLMSTYAEILKSRSVIQAVIDRTQSDEKKPSSYQAMLSRISTHPVKDTEILKISVRAASPEEAQLLANSLVDTFIERLTFLVRSEQKTVGEFIGERLQESKLELERTEAILEAYKRNERIVAPAEETRALVDHLAAINKLEAENTVNLAIARARLNNVKQQLGQEKPEYIADSPLIQQYKAKLADLEVQLVGLLQNYTEKHPQVLTLRAAIAETKLKLNLEIGRVINSEVASINPIHQGLLQTKLQSEAEIAAGLAQKEAIAKIITQSEYKIAQLPQKEHGLARVMRDAAVAQEIYIMLAKRHEEAQISEVMQPTDVQIVDLAVAPDKKQPIKPNIRLNLMVAALLGLFGGVGLAFVLEHLNKTITTSEDVAYYLDLPVLGSIPRFENERPQPGLGEALRRRFGLKKKPKR